jgi:hypothetical protein
MNFLRRHLLPAALGALTVGLTACPERDPLFDTSLETLAPVAAGQTLTWVDRGATVARTVDLSGATAVTRSVAIGRDPTLATARQGGTPEVLVLSRGSRGEPGVAPAPGTLHALSPSGAAPRTYTVASPFNALAQDADGRFAITYFRAGAASERLLFNPNQIAVVDLTAAPSERNPVLRTVRSFGGVPNAVVFSPPMMINGAARSLAVVLSDAYVTLLDLTNPTRSEISVRLTLPEDTRAIRPSQVLFDGEQATVYVRAAASNDVYALRLVSVTPDGPQGNDFRPSINQLAAGLNPSDMALIGEAAERKLLVVSPGSRDARVIDARANTTVTIPLTAAATRILLFRGSSPRDPMPAPRALLVGDASSAAAVSFLELTDITARRGQNVETVPLPRAASAVLPLPERDAVMIGHATNESTGQISLLDLTRRTVSPILAEVSLNDARFDSDRQRLWVAPRGTTRVGWIDLRTFSPGELRLDQPVTGVFPLPGPMGAPGRVVALHEGNEGALTLLDAADLRRETARTLRGFLLDNLLAGAAR